MHMFLVLFIWQHSIKVEKELPGNALHHGAEVSATFTPTYQITYNNLLYMCIFRVLQNR